MQAFIPGLYPRSEALVQATRDLDRGRTTAGGSRRAGGSRPRRVRLGPAGSGARSPGGRDAALAGHLPPLVVGSDGLETGALTRFLDTNTFFRAPSATAAEPTLQTALDERYIARLPGPRLVTLPSPFALAHGTDVEPKAVAEGVLKPQLDAIDAELVVLEEPFLAREESRRPRTRGGGPREVLEGGRSSRSG